MSTREEVKRQYEEYPYPAPIDTIRRNSGAELPWDSLRRNFYKCWPFEKETEELDVLIAGCGSVQAPVVALASPSARIQAIDISSTSLAHTEALIKKYNIKNLKTTLLPVEEVASLNMKFDYIVCTGVLHHLESPLVGTKALRSVLRVKGSRVKGSNLYS